MTNLKHGRSIRADVAFLVAMAVMGRDALAEERADGRPDAFAAIDHEEETLGGIQSPIR